MYCVFALFIWNTQCYDNVFYKSIIPIGVEYSETVSTELFEHITVTNKVYFKYI